MILRLPVTQHTWLAPFACIGLIVLSLLRPTPNFPPPTQSRIVVDADGTSVPISLPFRGTFDPRLSGYLEHTRAPETLLKVGDDQDRARFSKGFMSLIFPDVVKKNSLWDVGFSGHGRYAEVETLFTYDAGAYIAVGDTALLRRVGLPALALSWHENNWDDVCFSEARIETRLIGQPERGEALIARYKKAYADLDQELQTATLTSHLRILIMGTSSHNWRHYYVKGGHNSYQIYLPPAGLVNASEGWMGEQQDAERILAMDPDFIFEMGRGEGLRDFENDPRWRGLKAVQDKRIYIMPGLDNESGRLAGLIFQPLWVRWMAELTHPDRLRPKLREVMRERLMSEFGYRLSDEQIDLFLRFDSNSNSAGYARFKRDDLARN